MCTATRTGGRAAVARERTRRLHPGVHLDALSSGLPLNVDLDTALTVIAGNLCRLLARRLPRYVHATPDRHFLDSTGALHLTDDQLILELRVRTCHPVLIDAGLVD
jgi:hypothetical protein